MPPADLNAGVKLSVKFLNLLKLAERSLPPFLARLFTEVADFRVSVAVAIKVFIDQG